MRLKDGILDFYHDTIKESMEQIFDYEKSNKRKLEIVINLQETLIMYEPLLESYKKYLENEVNKTDNKGK